LTIIKPTMLAKMRGTDRYFVMLERLLEQMVRQSGSEIAALDGTNVDGADIPEIAVNTSDITANAVHGQDVVFTWNTDTAGVWPAGDPTRALTVTFTGDGITTSPTTHTVTATLTSATGFITIADTSQAGDASTYSRVARERRQRRRFLHWTPLRLAGIHPNETHDHGRLGIGGGYVSRLADR